MKKWTSPELTILVRSKTEEVVLTGCKVINYVGGPYSVGTSCVTFQHNPCRTIAGS